MSLGKWSEPDGLTSFQRTESTGACLSVSLAVVYATYRIRTYRSKNVIPFLSFGKWSEPDGLTSFQRTESTGACFSVSFAVVYATY